MTPLILLVVLALIVPKKNVVDPEAGGGIPDPLRLDAEKDPHPSSEHLKKLDEEYPSLQVAELVQAAIEFYRPCTPQHQIHADHKVVEVGHPEDQPVSQ